MAPRRLIALVAATLSFAASAALATGGAVAQADDARTVHVLTFNDFHGRIDAAVTVPWAATLEQEYLRDADNSIVVSGGDNVGASLFASFIQNDEPTIQVLNDLAAATRFEASAVGNHEFDQGLADLKDRIISGQNGAVRADWAYLGANVVDKATQQPVFDAYHVYTLPDGLRIAVIGAVTQETPALVSPAGVNSVDFTDPVAAVNRAADEITARNLADIVVADYHEGAATAKSLDDAISQTQVFERIVNDTNQNVDAIVTAHTHLAYAWNGLGGEDPLNLDTHQGRPVIQAGSYGAYVGVLDLVWDPATKTVTSGTARNVAAMAAPAPGSAEEAAMLAVGNVATIKAHVDAALAEAATKGDRGVAQVTADVTTAQTKGEWVDGRYVNTGAATRDDRANESSLATLVADAFLAAADGSDVVGGADIGVINAGGGLRAELLQAPDGKITYAEANAILPFVNNIYTVTLTGAQLKTFLEEQWQTDADGNRPARPFLATGVSSNVTYTVNTDVPTAEPCTLEANCGWDDARSHVTSVSVNGAALEAAKEYKVVTISFLTSGGDNYRVMTQGKDVVDTGLVDRDLWIETLMDLSGVAAPDAPATDSIKPSFARSSVVVTNLAPATAPMASVAVEAGAKITATLSRLNLTSLGAVANTDTLSLLLKPSDLTGGNIDFDSFKSKVVGQGPVTAPGDKAGCTAAGVSGALNEASTGCSKLDVTIPATTTPGDYVLLTAVFPSETLIWLPVQVLEAGGATESSTPPTSSTSTSASGVSSTSFTLSPTSSSDLPGTGAQANRATVAAAWLATIVGLALILIAAQRRGAANASNRGL